MKVTGSQIRLFFHTFVDGAGRSHETPRYPVGIRRDSHENTRNPDCHGIQWDPIGNPAGTHGIEWNDRSHLAVEVDDDVFFPERLARETQYIINGNMTSKIVFGAINGSAYHNRQR